MHKLVRGEGRSGGKKNATKIVVTCGARTANNAGILGSVGDTRILGSVEVSSSAEAAGSAKAAGSAEAAGSTEAVSSAGAMAIESLTKYMIKYASQRRRPMPILVYNCVFILKI
ncbi:PREDICTED: uncharacterized protein LOC108762052 [Trachymyrmex cornetzi]|uniref:uncharacterized protein LOC108762052 n=1 Tax=Trachymyrmex cornetzi TaxID=471704 RepID=UPI00084F6795|nr:PREDICTED: uncharacterized protein LOC108762052 [Trachymyrmex cornetzi]